MTKRRKQIRQYTTKPIYFSEAGTDSWDNKAGVEDQASQASAVINIWNQISNNNDVAGVTFMTWQDEWWKDNEGSLSTHDIGGFSKDCPV